MGITEVPIDVKLGGDSLRVAKEASTEERVVTFLPDPARRTRRYTVISVDDHLVEPPDTFSGRLPSKFAERGPKIVDTEDGGQAWLYDGVLMPNVGFNAVVGRPKNEHTWEPCRFSEMREGAWNPLARAWDMDLAGIYASLCFPSFVSGFGGARLQTVTPDRDLALASVRAWNNWHLEAWVGLAPDRFIPCQIPWLHDPVEGAEEIRRNALRGFRAISFPEAPHKFGFPSIHTSHWDPMMRACAETETVVCVHTGSGGALFSSSTPGAPPAVGGLLFGVYGMLNTIEWLCSSYAAKFPSIKLCMSEGGIGWIPAVMDRAEQMLEHGHSGLFSSPDVWRASDLTPLEALKKNFWFCFIFDPTTIPSRHAIGVDRLMFEVDYPHSDTNWPDTQAQLDRHLQGLPTEDVARLTWRNASELFKHPVPESIQSDPESF